MITYFSRDYIFPERKLEQIVFLFIFLIAGLGVYFSHSNPLFFEQNWTGKHGWVEYLIMLGLFCGVIVNVYRANILYPFRSNLFIVCTWMMAFVFFFCFGEKISWGQYLFDFQPIDFFIRYNARGETNLYHLQFGDWSMGSTVFNQILEPLFIVYILVFPLAYGKWNPVTRLVDHLGLPLPRLYHTVGYLALLLLCRGVAEGPREDILEFGWSWFLLLVWCRPYNRRLFSRVSFER